MMNDKKGNINLLIPLCVTIAVAAIFFVFSADILTDIGGGFGAASYADNITDSGLGGLGELSAQQPNIGKLAGVAVILGLVIGLGYYAFALQNRQA